jgi:hypothetical protein
MHSPSIMMPSVASVGSLAGDQISMTSRCIESASSSTEDHHSSSVGPMRHGSETISVSVAARAYPPLDTPRRSIALTPRHSRA